jgi:hypothetical protein
MSSNRGGGKEKSALERGLWGESRIRRGLGRFGGAGGRAGGTAPAQTAAVATGTQAFEVAVEGAGGGMDEFAHDTYSFQGCNFWDVRHSDGGFLRLR